MIPTDSDRTASVVFVDVDGDRDLDVVIGNEFSTSRVHRNDGSGHFTWMPAALPALDRVAHIAAGDADGDGDVDLFVSRSGRQNLLLRNDGKGRFTDATAGNLPTDDDNTASATFADLDGDKDLDLFLATNANSFQRRPSRIYLNDGTGKFTTAPANLPSRTDATRRVALGDVDGDGDTDAVLANADFSRGAQNRLYLNDGKGVFSDATATQLPAFLDPTTQVRLVDIDGDKDLDLVVANSDDDARGQERVLVNDGRGVFKDETATRLPTLQDQTLDIILFDVDRDGDVDLLSGNLANIANGQNRLFLNDGKGVFQPAPSGSLPELVDNTIALAHGDVDGDGDMDVWVGNSTLNSVHGQDVLYLNDGKGRFMDASSPGLPADNQSTFKIRLADLDGDGDLDMFCANAPFQRSANGQDGVYLNDGTGVFVDVTASNVPTESDFGLTAAIGDVDGDKDLDILVGNQQRVQRLLLNDGKGGFTNAPTQIPGNSNLTFDIALGDVDGDGDLDAFLANARNFFNSYQNQLWLNDGKGKFTDATSQLPADRDWSTAVALGDVDGDGDLDALTGNSATGGTPRARLYLNDGKGRFVSAQSQIPVSNRGWTPDVALVDVDGDKDLDAVLASSQNANSDGFTLLWLNDGNGKFTDASSQLPRDRQDTNAIACRDLDGDGDVDIVLGNDPLLAPPGGNRVYVNDGKGSFRDATATFLPFDTDDTVAIAIGDTDQDGDMDIVLGNARQRNRVYVNRTRQTAWRGVPRVGQPLVIDMHGSPGGDWGLCAGLRPARIPSPIGLMQIDPTSVVWSRLGKLDASGTKALTFAVPNVAALAGLVVYWQAFVTPPLRVTNLEATRFSAF